MHIHSHRKHVLVGMILLCLAPALVYPQIEATDETGRRVLLYEDGRWEAAAPDVRSLYWGMTKEQVMHTERVRLISDGNTLIGLNIPAFGMKGMMFLEFDQGLALAGFLFMENYEDGNAYIEDYHKIVKDFTDRYGEPDDVITEWTGTKQEDLGEAFLTGALQLRTEWHLERSNIACGLLNDQDLFGILVGYEVSGRY